MADRFDHELTMVLHDNDGMVVVTGCSHRGVLNLIDAATELFPVERLRAVVDRKPIPDVDRGIEEDRPDKKGGRAP